MISELLRAGRLTTRPDVISFLLDRVRFAIAPETESRHLRCPYHPNQSGTLKKTKHQNVGEFENSASAYGTFDQGGNILEWNEAIVYEGSIYGDRGLRGGSFSPYGGDVSALQASARNDCVSTNENDYIGFRVSQVPEQSSIIALAGGLVGLLGIRRRRA
jgi:hypothetical protein